MMRNPRVALLMVAGLLTLGGVYQATPASACIIGCTDTPTASGALLGGGIPLPDAYGHIRFDETFTGQVNQQPTISTLHVDIDSYTGTGSVFIQGYDQSFDAFFTRTELDSYQPELGPYNRDIPGIVDITIGDSPSNPRGITGHINATRYYSYATSIPHPEKSTGFINITR